MPKKLYFQTRLYNVNDRLASLYLCEQVDRVIDQRLLYGFEHCYLPYRDSDSQIPDDVPDVGQAIFDRDVATLKSSVGVVGNYDGVGYDSGCGFEIGLAYSFGYPINLISTDFMKWSIDSDEYYIGSPLLQHVAKVVSITEDDKNIKDYRTQQEDLRDRNMRAFLGNLVDYFETHQQPPVPLKPLDKDTDFFIDPNFDYTDGGRWIMEELSTVIKQSRKTQGGVSNSYPAQCIDSLRRSRAAVFYGDTFEHNLDSCILQGIAYGLGIPIVVFCSDRHSYNDGRLVGKKNVMITYSANHIVTSVGRFVDVIPDLLK